MADTPSVNVKSIMLVHHRIADSDWSPDIPRATSLEQCSGGGVFMLGITEPIAVDGRMIKYCVKTKRPDDIDKWLTSLAIPAWNPTNQQCSWFEAFEEGRKCWQGALTALQSLWIDYVRILTVWYDYPILDEDIERFKEFGEHDIKIYRSEPTYESILKTVVEVIGTKERGIIIVSDPRPGEPICTGLAVISDFQVGREKRAEPVCFAHPAGCINRMTDRTSVLYALSDISSTWYTATEDGGRFHLAPLCETSMSLFEYEELIEAGCFGVWHGTLKACGAEISTLAGGTVYDNEGKKTSQLYDPECSKCERRAADSHAL